MSLVEQPPGGLDHQAKALRYRLDQQEVLADFGRQALGCRDLDALLAIAAELCAKGLCARFSKVLEHRPDRRTLFLRAGIGWREGLVGANEVDDGPETPAGYSLQCGEPVIANQHASDQRFQTPDFMVEHGIARAINVPVDVDGKRFGVLEVDSAEDNRFVADDIAFLQAFANLLGLAIGRIEVERALERAHQHQQLLTREVSHRVKNSLAMVSALLGLRMRGIDDAELRRILTDAQHRIHTIARAHDLLWRGDRVGNVPLDALIGELAEELVAQAPGHHLSCRIEHIELEADTAIPLGLMVTELVTNALKYAYDAGGEIGLEISTQGDELRLVVRDRGRGLPEGVVFDGRSGEGLGARIIASTARQLRGHLSVADARPGTEVRFSMPLPADANNTHAG